MRLLADSFATLISNCMMPPEHLERIASPDGLRLGTEFTCWYVPAIGKVVVWDMVTDPEMSATLAVTL
jgi:hypothetical protein